MTPQIEQRIEQIRRGEVPEGYKKTKVGIIPVEWKENELGKYISEYRELSNDISQYPVYSSSRKGLLLQSEYYDNRESVETNVGYRVVPQGYVTYRHMSDDDVFHFNINNTLGLVLVSSEYPVFNAKKNACRDYVIPFINTMPRFRYYCRTQKMGGTRTRLYFKNLCKFIMAFPPLAEQEKIAEVLETQDRVISLCEKKVEELKKLKKAFLQKMFPKPGATVPEWRFPGFTDTWEPCKFGEFLSEFCLKTKTEDEYPLLSSTNKGMESRSGRVSGESNVGYKIIDNGDVVLSPQNLWLGNININSIGKGIVSPSYKTFKILKIESSFIHPQLRTHHLLNAYKDASTQGASVVRRNLEPDMFFEIRIMAPSKPEQRKIGSLFAHLDNLITLHQRKCDEEKQKKKALMQLLLTGIVRAV